MSRYHSVRPSQHKHQQVPQPAAPVQPSGANTPMPSQAQMEQVARRQLRETVAELYRLHHGPELDASIARWKKLLEVHDREVATLDLGDGSKPHRWTVSPSIAFRVDKMLHELLARQQQLNIQCLHEAKDAIAHMMSTQTTKDASLCPPKSPEPAPQAESRPDAPAMTQPAQAQTQERSQAPAATIAA